MTATLSGARCYGYTPGGEVIDAEADVIRFAVHLLLRKDYSLRRAADALTAAGHRTTLGGPWSAVTLRRLLIHPRLAGLATKARGSTEPSPAILTEDQHEQLLARTLIRRQRAGARGGRHAQRLLTGLVFCSRCGAAMTSHSNPYGRSYRCPVRSYDEHGRESCGRPQIQAEPLEEYVSGRTLERLLDRAEHPVRPHDPVQVLRDRLAELDERRAQLDLQRESLSAQEFAAERVRIKSLRYDLKGMLARARDIEEMPRVLPGPSRVGAWWRRATEHQRRLVLAELWDGVVIGEPTRHGRTGLDEARVTLVPSFHRTLAAVAS